MRLKNEKGKGVNEFENDMDSVARTRVDEQEP